MNETNDLSNLFHFAQVLRKLRQANNLTQEQLAEKLDITPSAITMYETGLRNPSLKILFKISEFFNVSIDELLGNNHSNINKLDTSLSGFPIEDFKKLTPSQKEQIKSLIEFLIHKNNNN